MATAGRHRILAAWAAFYRFRLTSTDAELTRLAWSAVEEAAQVAKAADEAELRDCGEKARVILEDFVTAAAQHFKVASSQRA